MVVTLRNAFHLLQELLYKCKVWWNKIVKGFELLVLKGFEWFWCCLCLVHGRRMVGHTSYASTIEGWKNSCAIKNINFHSYVINIHSFGPIHVHVLQEHVQFYQHKEDSQCFWKTFIQKALMLPLSMLLGVRGKDVELDSTTTSS